MLYKRTIEKTINEYLTSKSNKIFFLWGPRRSGKTTLIRNIAERESLPIFNFDVVSDREKFIPDREILGKLAAEHKVLLIDEVQNFPQSTIALKILYDEFGTKIIATGSSELRQKAGEDFDTLAGRYTDQFCLPLSVFEILNNEKPKAYDQDKFELQLAVKLQQFGTYPEIYTTKFTETEKIAVLQNILDTYVLKDVVNIYNLKNDKLAKDILTKIALQLGSEVSLREIAASLQANVTTVSNYIEIFIKNYVLIALPSFKTNLRKAVSANRKLYFYDLGLRNMLVKDFRDLDLRQDKGGVFENFIISEFEKYRKTNKIPINLYFYREYDGREIDLILEDYHKKYTAVELKYSKYRSVKKDVFPIPHSFFRLNMENYTEVIKDIFSQP